MKPQAEKRISKAIHAPGIPAPVTKASSKMLAGFVNTHWIPPWILSMVVLIIGVFIAKKHLYGEIWEKLPDDADINIHAKGCDVVIESSPRATQSWIHMSWWKYYGASSLKLSGNKVDIKAATSRRSITFSCSVTIFAKANAILDKVNIAVVPSEATKLNTGASNTAEIMHVQVEDIVIKDALMVNVSTQADVNIIGVQVPEMKAFIDGGTLNIHEAIGSTQHPPWAAEKYTKKLYLPLSMDLHLEAATVVFDAHNADARVRIAQDTVDDAVLAAAKLEQVSDDIFQLYASKTPHGRPTVNIALSANDCAIYFSALDETHYFGHKGALGLDVHQGSSTVKGPRLLPTGADAMHELSKYLNKTTPGAKYVVYMDLTAPHMPRGTFRLLSTRSYLAFSLWSFALVSAGMLNPDIIRIATPLVGLNFLWPRTYNEGPITEEENKLLVKGMFKAVSEHVDLQALGLDPRTATWVWDPHGPEAFVFEYLPSKTGGKGTWSNRLVKASDVFSFRMAALITALLSAYLGVIVVLLFGFELVPLVRRRIQRRNMAEDSTFQLKLQVMAKDWNICAGFMSHPRPGILLRWAQRPKQEQFGSMKITCRVWPVNPSRKPIVVKPIDPTRLPVPRDAPSQQGFLVPSIPAKYGEKIKKKPQPNPTFYSELEATANLCISNIQMVCREAYQCQVLAYHSADCSGDPIDTSNWSSPVVCRSDDPFPEYPLWMWKSLCGILPEDTFGYFINNYCCPVSAPPKMALTFSNMKIALVNDSALFVGQADTYGQDLDQGDTSIKAVLKKGPSTQQGVKVVISTGGDEQTAADSFYKDSPRLPLPGCYDQKRIQALQTFEQVMNGYPQSPDVDKIIERAKFCVLDYKTYSMSVDVGLDTTQILRIEAVVGSDAEGDNFKNTARYQATFDEVIALFKRAKPLDDVPRTTHVIGDQIVMRDGLMASAMLMADITVTNSGIKGDVKPSETDGKMPQVFSEIPAGQTYLWGESVLLTWKHNPSCTLSHFDIIMTSEELYCGDRKPNKKNNATTVVARNVPTTSEKVRIRIGPDPPKEAFWMKARLGACEPGKTEIQGAVAKSPEYVVVKPVTLQDLELGYAAFCERNGIPMQIFPQTGNLTLTYGFDVVQKTFSVVNHYRQPLPISTPGDPECGLLFGIRDKTQGAPLVYNPGSCVIVGDDALNIKKADQEDGFEKSTFERTTSPHMPAADMETGKPQAKTLALEIVPKTYPINIPTNLFWKENADWQSRVLFRWQFMPNIASEGYLAAWLTEHIGARLASYFGWVDNLFRLILIMILWWSQLFVVTAPAWLLITMWVKHDTIIAEVNPNMDSPLLDTLEQSSLYGYMVGPSYFKWNRLRLGARIVFVAGSVYTILSLILTFYGNFLHHGRPNVFMRYVNSGLVAIYMCTLFAIAFYATMAITWVLMGSLISPEQFLPYALAVVGIMVLVKSTSGNLQNMKNQALNGIQNKLDIVTHAIVAIFIGKAGTDAVAVQHTEYIDFTSKVTALMAQVEKKTAKQLYWQSELVVSVDAVERDATLLLRESPAFKMGVSTQENHVYATDFVQKKYWAHAQAYSNDHQLIKDNRKTAVMTNGKLVLPDEAIAANALHRAMAEDSLQGVDLTSSDADEVSALATSLGLRAATAEAVRQAFGIANNTAAQSAGIVGTLTSPDAIAPILSAIREEQLFKLFLHANVTPDDMKTEKECKLADQRFNFDDDKRIANSIVKQYIVEMNRAELENLDAKLATCLTKLLNWNTVGRKSASYATKDIPGRIVTGVIEKHLNTVINGTAAYNVMMTGYQKAFDHFDSYKDNPNQFFIDCSIIEAKFAASKEAKAVLKFAVDNQRAFDGSLSPDALLAALRWLILPSSRTEATTVIGTSFNKLYLWKDALVSILTSLGWNKDELDDDWINSVWLEETDNQGVFPYEDIDEIAMLITAQFANGGIWKAAMKSLCLHCQISGYVGCDMIRDGRKDAAERAHKIHDATSVVGQRFDFAFINENLRWPDWVKDVWDCIAEKSPHGDPQSAPRFLPINAIVDFFQALVYQPVDKKTAQEVSKAPLNLYPTDCMDLQWQFGEDKCIWQTTPQGDKRLRGVWLELMLNLSFSLECLPHDLDLYYQSLAWQEDAENFKKPVLMYHSFKKWLDKVFVTGKKDPRNLAITRSQWDKLLNDYMNFGVPAAILEKEVFLPCPTVPGDDQFELRFLHDLSAALRLWLGYGMWKGAIKQVVEAVVPRGDKRAMALKIMPAEFDNMDIEGKGVLQPGQALMLMHKLVKPGLTLSEVTSVLHKDMGLKVPERQVHKYFTDIDINGDGILQVTEFISFLRIIMIDFYPAQILDRLNFTTAKMIKIITMLVLCFVGIFIAMTLVIKAFETDPSISSSIHSTFSAGSVVMMKMQSDSNIGANEAMSAIRERIDNAVMLAITSVLGLAPAVIDQLKQLFTELL